MRFEIDQLVPSASKGIWMVSATYKYPEKIGPVDVAQEVRFTLRIKCDDGASVAEFQEAAYRKCLEILASANRDLSSTNLQDHQEAVWKEDEEQRRLWAAEDSEFD